MRQALAGPQAGGRTGASSRSRGSRRAGPAPAAAYARPGSRRAQHVVAVASTAAEQRGEALADGFRPPGIAHWAPGRRGAPGARGAVDLRHAGRPNCAAGGRGGPRERRATRCARGGAGAGRRGRGVARRAACGVRRAARRAARRRGGAPRRRPRPPRCVLGVTAPPAAAAKLPPPSPPSPPSLFAPQPRRSSLRSPRARSASIPPAA
jgi:hypothetical protein